ncbi:MAG: DUF1223 domain-containing protein [Pseudomonadota bacterium]
MAGLLLWGSVVSAQAQGPVVVELFTSQGCANCPPADALLGELAGHEDVIALGLHVDYWDYIGWADTFADAAHTARQYGYARAAGSTVVYTPQMVIGGMGHVAGHRPMAVLEEIMAHVAAPDPVALDISAEGEGAYLVRADVTDGDAPEAGMVVHLVSYLPHEEVDIRRGINADQTIDYHNIVRSWQVVAEWNGAGPHSVQINLEGALPFVLIVQQAGFGPIMAAARLD